jgi:hypothetical protein
MLDRIFHNFFRLLVQLGVALDQERLIHLLHKGVEEHFPFLVIQNIPDQWLLNIFALFGGAEPTLARGVLAGHHNGLALR